MVFPLVKDKRSMMWFLNNVISKGLEIVIAKTKAINILGNAVINCFQGLPSFLILETMYLSRLNIIIPHNIPKAIET